MPAFDIDAIDEVIHARMRLGIMAYLARMGDTDFPVLKQALGATQGNLSVHLRTLEEAGYLALDKRIEDRKTRTTARMTPAGREAFAAYIAALGALIAA